MAQICCAEKETKYKFDKGNVESQVFKGCYEGILEI